jgi:hypothetical protein
MLKQREGRNFERHLGSQVPDALFRFRSVFRCLFQMLFPLLQGFTGSHMKEEYLCSRQCESERKTLRIFLTKSADFNLSFSSDTSAL